MADLIDSTWHLAQTEPEMRLASFELELWRLFQGFLRWQEDCERCFNSYGLSGNDISVLHLIRARNNPKTIYDVARILNREDMYNLQYSVKKLERLGLIEKTVTKSKKMTTYAITEKGITDTDVFTTAKRNILVDLFKKQTDLKIEEVTAVLVKLKTMYDEAGQIAASYKGLGHEIIKEK